MGTKNDPGDYDCYDAAHPDEPLFTLRAKDPLAPILVELWAQMRVLTEGPSGRTDEARACAWAMDKWRSANGL